MIVKRNLAPCLRHRWRERDAIAARRFHAGHPADLLQRYTCFPGRP